MKFLLNLTFAMSVSLGFVAAMTTDNHLWLVAAIAFVILFVALPLNIIACNTSEYVIENQEVEPDD